jgi:hypothetical protein
LSFWERLRAYFGLGCLLQGGEVGGPEAVEEVPNGEEPVGTHDEQVAGAVVAFGDETRTAEDTQVEGHRLLGHGDVYGDFADGAGLVADKRKNPAAVAVGEGVEGGVHGYVCGDPRIQAETCTKSNVQVSA